MRGGQGGGCDPMRGGPGPYSVKVEQMCQKHVLLLLLLLYFGPRDALSIIILYNTHTLCMNCRV